jgi:hypothetical protein
MGKPSSRKEDSQTTTTKLQGKGNVASLAEKLAAGVQKHLSTLAQVIIGSGTFTPVQVAAQLLAFAKLRNDVDAAKAALKAKLVDEKAQGPALRAFFYAVLLFVRAAFGNSPDILADFGLAPKKGRTPQTVEQKAAAAAKRAATRKARGTAGSRKRKAIKGDVTGVEITPVTTASASQPAQNAPSAPAGAPTTGSPTK